MGDDWCTYAYWTRTFSTVHKMMNHVNNHLKNVSLNQRLSCRHPVCQFEGLILDNLQHFKNHVATVHRITLRAWYVFVCSASFSLAFLLVMGTFLLLIMSWGAHSSCHVLLRLRHVLLDWGMRLYELRKKLDGKVISIGNGWYWLVRTFNCPPNSNVFSLVLPLPRHRLDGCACTSPLAHFYIHHAQSFVRELHPFTTITHLASQNTITPQTEDDILIKFLFRKSGRSSSVPDTPSRKHVWAMGFGLLNLKVKPTFQWTDKLASLADQRMPISEGVDDFVLDQSNWAPFSGQSTIATLDPNHPHQTVDIGLRLESPYFIRRLRTPQPQSKIKCQISHRAPYHSTPGAALHASSPAEINEFGPDRYTHVRSVSAWPQMEARLSSMFSRGLSLPVKLTWTSRGEAGPLSKVKSCVQIPNDLAA